MLTAAVLAAPAAVGVAVHATPYALLAALGRLPDNRGVRSTVKLLGSLGLYPVIYAALGVAAGRRRGWAVGLAAAGGAPACGWIALRGPEMVDKTVRARRAARLHRRGPLDAVVARRASIADGVATVARRAPDPEV